MICRDVTPLLSAERDGPLDAVVREAVARHVAACPACARTRLILAEAADSWRFTTSLTKAPEPAGEWRILRARLRNGGTPAPRRVPAWLLSAGALPVAAAALWLVFFSVKPGVPAAAPASRIALANPAAHADYVETPANTTPLVFIDQESGWLIVWAEAPASPVSS